MGTKKIKAKLIKLHHHVSYIILTRLNTTVVTYKNHVGQCIIPGEEPHLGNGETTSPINENRFDLNFQVLLKQINCSATV